MKYGNIINSINNWDHADNDFTDTLNNMYNDSLRCKETVYEIPGFIGKGFCKRQIINESFHLYTNHIEVHKEIQMSGEISECMYIMSFSMSDGMAWSDQDNKTSFMANNNDVLLHKIENYSILSTYIPNQVYKGINITIEPSRFRYLKDSLGNHGDLFSYATKDFKMNQMEASIETQLILKDILECPYKGKIKEMYLEGKVLQLIAVSLHQLVAYNGVHMDRMDISRTEMESLHRAKDILDNSIASPPTLKELSRQVCLNEFKLKTGFKKLYDKPVYAYILDKRMQLARFLLETKDVKVSEVASLIGYSNGNNFSRAFKKQYGFNPSEYLNKINNTDRID